MAHGEDLQEVVESLGVEVRRQTGDELQGRCPVHHLYKGRDSSRHSWYINVDSGLWHCLTGDTLVLTPHGRRRIDKLSAAQTGWLLDGNGEWQFTSVRHFGKQEVWDVVVSRNGIERSIRATAKHRWVTRHGEKTTDCLTTGTRIPSVFTKAPTHGAVPNREAIQAGFVFGDGHRLSSNGEPYATRAEFFNEYDLEVAEYFDAPVKRSKEYWRIDPLPLEYKDLPDDLLWATPSYTFWWLAGYFAADGSCTPGVSTPTMSSAFRENLEAVYDMCVNLGIRTSEVRSTSRVGIDGVRRPLFQLSFYGGLSSEFFLRSDQRSAFESISKKYERTGWTVRKVVRTGAVEDVYCAVMPSTASFVLDGNILTGNCFTCGARGNLPSLVSALSSDPNTITRVHLFLAKSGLDRLERADDEEPEVLADWRTYAHFDKVPGPLLDARNIDRTQADRYGLRFNKSNQRDPHASKDRPDYKCLIVPVLDERGSLRGWQAKQRKYFANVPEGLKKSRYLFGANFGHPADQTAVLVESPLDVVRFHSVLPNDTYQCVASFGASVSTDQIRTLLRYKSLVIALDNDGAGRLESSRLRSLGFRQDLRFLYYGHTSAKDIGDMTDAEIVEATERSTTIWT